MNGFFLALIVGQASGSYHLLDRPIEPKPKAQISWRLDYDAALKEAKESGKRLFFDVRSANCIWCDRLEEQILKDQAVVAALGNFVCVKVHRDAYPAIVDSLGITQFPTLIVAAPDSTIERVDVGFVGAATLISRLNPQRQVRSSTCSPACVCGCNAGGECRCRAVSSTTTNPARTISAEWCGPRG